MFPFTHDQHMVRGTIYVNKGCPNWTTSLRFDIAFGKTYMRCDNQNVGAWGIRHYWPNLFTANLLVWLQASLFWLERTIDCARYMNAATTNGVLYIQYSLLESKAHS